MEKSKKIKGGYGMKCISEFMLRGWIKGRVKNVYEKDGMAPGGRRLCKLRFKLEVILGRWEREELVLETDDRKSMMGVLWGEETREMVEVVGRVRRCLEGTGFVPVLEVWAVGPAGSCSEIKSK